MVGDWAQVHSGIIKLHDFAIMGRYFETFYRFGLRVYKLFQTQNLSNVGNRMIISKLDKDKA